MNILKQLLSSSADGDLLSALTKSGFSTEQAEKFLPAASESVARAASELDLSGGNAGDLLDSLSQSIDIEALASKVGLDSAMVNTGLTVLLPQLVKLLQGNGLSSLLSRKGLGGLLAGLVGKN